MVAARRRTFRAARTLPLQAKDLLLPWTGSRVKPTDFNTSLPNHLPCPKCTKEMESPALATELSTIELIPAPGENFHLEISCVDELLNPVTISIFIRLRVGLQVPNFIRSLCLLQFRKRWQRSLTQMLCRDNPLVRQRAEPSMIGQTLQMDRSRKSFV